MTAGRRFGPWAVGEGCEFRLWAPTAHSVEVVTTRATPMMRSNDGWFHTTLPDARVGARYRFRIDGELEVPDPASAFQPNDVFGASEIVDHRYDWRTPGWRGRPWHEAVILELHIGTFTPHGTFRAAIGRLDHVVQTGFTAIELMPVADFFGRRNWGYDGVLWFAPDSVYGRPDDLQALVDAAHARGLMVFLDVVYNHFGPEGNFLPRYAAAMFARDSHTPWGSAIDFAVPEVRDFVIENALHWLTDYRFDGLRLDAVHAIAQRGTPSILDALSKAVGELARVTGRHIHLVLENDRNEASLLDPAEEPPRGRFRAQWNDDYHHAWHVLLTGERAGYYRDYACAPLRDIARVFASGFAYQGEASPHRNGARRGENSAHLPPTAFVSFLQNHDQIGNRAFGERLEQLARRESIEAALAVTLLAPMPPLMFMGEEWGETRPFLFFCDFRGQLADAVREGRRKECRAADADAVDVPDPLSFETFCEAKLDWDKLDTPHHAARLALVRRLLELRAQHVTPRLASLAGCRGQASLCGAVLAAAWRLDGGTLHLTANLGDAPAEGHLPQGRAIWGEPRGETLAPWCVFWTWED